VILIDWDTMLPTAQAACPAESNQADLTEGVASAVPQRDDPPLSPGIDAGKRYGDERRYCTECGNLTEDGRCLAAYRREIVASRSYSPVRDLLRRCEGFKPLPTDPDQRHGRDKWGWLRRYSYCSSDSK
jgi:hypothetical protein